ncbi:MAG TPA: EF-Tu/IF-2/RF-3 family GTPase, partial [Vicinamibacteria bacterium]|nr:EF-Tu/IF-2/RF-3 family GTPase [Vicinamibacteria bacterium]
LLVLTKCDIASPDSQAVAEMEARELVLGSFLEGAPAFRVSARTGSGLDLLKDALRSLAGEAAPRDEGGLVRLPVDRAFTVRGFGTVVTGTLVSGAIAMGTELELLPKGIATRVRGIEVHGAAVDRVGAGHRAALNLAGIELGAVRRGDVLVEPKTVRATSMIDAEVSLLNGAKPLRNQARVRLHLGSAEILARVHLLGAASLSGGEKGLAQLRLETPGVAGRGDLFILRAYSPPMTIGGGAVLDPLPPKRRRDRDRLIALRGASPSLAAQLFIAGAGQAGIDGSVLAARVTKPLSELLPALVQDPEVVATAGDPPVFLSRATVDGLARLTLDLLRRFHQENPLKAAMTREELRHKLFEHVPPATFDFVLVSLGSQLRLAPGTVSLEGHSIRLTA